MSNLYENKQSFRIAAYFAVIGLFWIYGSDFLVELINKDAHSYRIIQSVKGSFFVLTVSTIIFFLIRGLLLKIRANNMDVITSEKRLRKTLDNMIEGCQIIDFNWTYLYINDVAARHLRKTKEDLYETSAKNVYPGFKETVLYKYMQNCLAKKQAHKMEYKFDFPDGSHSWFEISVEPVPEGMLVLTYNITKRKEVLLALDKSEERLMDAQRIARLGDFKWYYKTGKVTWSLGLYELLGYSKKESIDYNMINTNIHHPDDLAKVTQWLKKAVQSGIAIIEPFEYRIVKNDKSVIYVRTSGIIDYSDPDSPVIFATVQDINERKLADIELIKRNEQLKKSLQKIEQINTELKKARNKAEKSDKLKTAFLANMSHEIRTPLNGIMGFSELLLNADNLNQKSKKKYADVIKKCSNNLLQIVNDILDISSLESGNFHLLKKEFKLKPLLDELNTVYSLKVSDTIPQCKLTLSGQHQDLILNTDEQRLRQVFVNLLDNAIKFTEKGEIEFGVYKKNKNTLEFFVKDSGIGIPKNDHKFIFDRFRQVGKVFNNAYGGNGLGLSIVKELLKLMDGNIWLESEENQGTTFYFSIPYTDKSL